jgi:hypothetical protein
LEKSMIVGLRSRDLGLLQHELRHDDAIRVSGPPPGQIAAVAAKPPEQVAAKLGSVGEGRRDEHGPKIAGILHSQVGLVV